MKFFILLILIVGCSTNTNYKEKLSYRIEDCMVRLADRGIDEKLVYSLCSNAHRLKSAPEEMVKKDE